MRACVRARVCVCVLCVCVRARARVCVCDDPDQGDTRDSHSLLCIKDRFSRTERVTFRAVQLRVYAASSSSVTVPVTHRQVYIIVTRILWHCANPVIPGHRDSNRLPQSCLSVSCVVRTVSIAWVFTVLNVCVCAVSYTHLTLPTIVGV